MSYGLIIYFLVFVSDFVQDSCLYCERLWQQESLQQVHLKSSMSLKMELGSRGYLIRGMGDASQLHKQLIMPAQS